MSQQLSSLLPFQIRILNGFCASDLEILTTPSEEITEFDYQLSLLVSSLKLACTQDPNGVGISAVQIGALKRVFVLRLLLGCDSKKDKKFRKLFDKDGWLVCVNPTFIPLGGNKKNPVKTGVSIEGCLSFPGPISGYYGKVWRYPKIKVTFWDVDGNQHSVNLEDGWAFVFQHELDHLNGTTFVSQVYEWITNSPPPKKIELIKQAEQKQS